MKGEIGKNVNVSIMDNTTVDQEQEVVISSSRLETIYCYPESQ